MKTKGIANVLIFLPHAAAVHPRLALIPKEDVRIDVKGCRYVPYVTVVRSGQGLAFSSSDTCVHAPAVYGAGFAPHGHVAPLTRPIRLVPRRRKEEKFMPAVLSCPIHACMRGFVLVLDHPYGTVTDSAGRFTIKDLPAGEHEFWTWHEKSGWIHKSLKVRVEADKTTDLSVLKVPVAKLTQD